MLALGVNKIKPCMYYSNNCRRSPLQEYPHTVLILQATFPEASQKKFRFSGYCP